MGGTYVHVYLLICAKRNTRRISPKLMRLVPTRRGGDGGEMGEWEQEWGGGLPCAPLCGGIHKETQTKTGSKMSGREGWGEEQRSTRKHHRGGGRREASWRPRGHSRATCRTAEENETQTLHSSQDICVSRREGSAVPELSSTDCED